MVTGDSPQPLLGQLLARHRLFRVWGHASSNKTTEWWAAANLNRFTRCYNIVGNILGKKGYTWLYEVEMTGFGSASTGRGTPGCRP